jgi:tyrosyl-DNA phosphodiesterase 2
MLLTPRSVPTLTRLPIITRARTFSAYFNMQALFEKALRDINAKKKSSVPWRRDQPYAQTYYSFSSLEDGWTSTKPDEHQTLGSYGKTPAKLSLYSWNVDFMLPHAKPRMTAALGHLASIITPTRPSALAVIFLQEMLDSDLTTISEHPDIRANFYMTDLTTEYWESGHYGTVTLIDKRLPIKDVFRVHYTDTRMERDALFVDVLHPSSPDKPIRFCNTHLESLIANPPLRPPQMKMAAKFMHDDAVLASILAGDLNAIQPFDKTLHSDNELKDAYLELGGDEDDAAGHTWGQQAATNLREQFGTSRMDKVFFCGDIDVTKCEKFGMDVVVADHDVEDDLLKLGLEKPWVTDHLGIWAEFAVKKRNEGMPSL